MGQRNRDHQAGIRTLLIPHLIADGQSCKDIASFTAVPLALVELIADESNPDPRSLCRGHTPATRKQRTTKSPRPTARHLTVLAIVTTAAIATIAWQIPFLPIGVLIAGITFYLNSPKAGT